MLISWELIALVPMLTILFLSLTGNILVVIAICTDKHLRKRSNSLYVSLAVADLLICLFVMSATTAIEVHGSWPFWEWMCKPYLSMDVMCCTASILNMASVAFDRYMHVNDPFRYDRIMRGRTFVCLITLVWTLGALVSFPPIYLGWHSLSVIQDEVNHDISLNLSETLTSSTPFVSEATFMTTLVVAVTSSYECGLHLNPHYAVISSIISFFLPCVVMIVLYLRLYLIACKHVIRLPTRFSSKKTHQARSNSLHPSPRHTNNDPRHGVTEEGRNLRNGRTSRPSGPSADHKAAITLGIIMGTFLFCFTPFFIINCINPFCNCIPDVVFKVFTWLGYANSSLNPIIYSLFNIEFRHAFQRILCQRLLRRRMGTAAPMIGGNLTRGSGPNSGQVSYIMTKSSSSERLKMTSSHTANKKSAHSSKPRFSLATSQSRFVSKERRNPRDVKNHLSAIQPINPPLSCTANSEYEEMTDPNQRNRGYIISPPDNERSSVECRLTSL